MGKTREKLANSSSAKDDTKISTVFPKKIMFVIR